MSAVTDISVWGLASAYVLLIFPLAVVLHVRVPIVGDVVLSILRMTAQLLFVGFYLQVVFKLNHPLLTLGWLLVMILVADGSILHGCGLDMRRFAGPVFLALVAGTLIPLAFMVGPLLGCWTCFDARYVIPLSGMIMGNCLRADIVGVKTFYQTVAKSEKAYHQTLAQGARLQEALLPYFRNAVQASLIPTVASMATIGLVSLPGMMTGVILGGADPMTAIKYQIAVMIAIFSGTAIAVFLSVRLTVRTSFDAYGILDPGIFRKRGHAPRAGGSTGAR